MFSLEGKVAVVTGAASGIGLATARRFSHAGATVVVADKNDATSVAREIGGLFIRTDVTREEQVKALMDETARRHGRIDIVINNAGGGDGSGANFISQLPAEDYESSFRLNSMGVLFGIKHSVDHMNNGGSIVNTASVAGIQGVAMYSPYVASKAAVIAITKTAALELAGRNIRVNCVCPGTVDTPMAYGPGGEAELKLSKLMMPLGRLCKPEEVAAAFHFLCSNDCSFISGQAICIDGGMTAGLSMGLVMPLLEML
ncbi:MAG: SDR family oxidoreductase [Candidatus Abyssobacteria bacterium SURF_5]|uniref:SDR family oxidoreductase n=1 Tax=Abyssobacteria bacterium (strain SURF_5) TaxID=2093360 RepID=A0A3A4N8G3_ABYX5|nr:MAG: SDR family oxidoreductase [Candidatus Abyssubacteria bacterium SURF_5]